MMNDSQDYNTKLEAVMYIPAKPKIIQINPDDTANHTDVEYECLSGKVRKLKTLAEVLQSPEFCINKQALFSANLLQDGSLMIVRVHSADSLISIERRK